MNNWKYTDVTHRVVSRVLENGSVESCLVEAIQDWLAAGNTPEPEDVISDEQWLDNEIRPKRNQLLSECDWTMLADAPLTTAQKALWQEYRQMLRDLPSTVDRENPVWPEKPIG